MPSVLLLCRTGDLAGLACPVPPDGLRLGRGAHCGVSLVHPQVSREHALVSRQEAGYIAEDLGSRNGTFVNGSAVGVGQPAPLEHLDHLALGVGVELVLLELDQVAASETVAAHLVDDEGHRIPLHVGANSVGSDPQSDLVIDTSSIAPHHAQLTLQATGLVVTRGAGARSLRVNRSEVGADVTETRLEHGDRLELAIGVAFGVELFRGLARPGEPSEDETMRDLDAVPAPDAAPPATPASAASPPAVTSSPSAAPARSSLAGLSRETDTLEVADIEDAVRKARRLHARLMARDTAALKQAQEESTQSGRGGAAVGPPLRSTAVQRSWAARDSPGGAPRLQAIRREVAVRARFHLPGEDSERIALLREGCHEVGRHGDCRLRIEDGSISRKHADVEVGPQGISVRDLGSTNGIFRGEERVTEVRLAFGEAIRFGRVTVSFEEV